MDNILVNISGIVYGVFLVQCIRYVYFTLGGK